MNNNVERVAPFSNCYLLNYVCFFMQFLNQTLALYCKKTNHTICNLTPGTAFLSHALSPHIRMYCKYMSICMRELRSSRTIKEAASYIKEICLIYWHLKCLLATKIIPMPNGLCKARLQFTVMHLILVLWVIMMGRPAQPYISMH